MVQCFQAMDQLPVTKLVRVRWNEPGIVGKVLDGGAYGVICPMVNTREEHGALQPPVARHHPRRGEQRVVAVQNALRLAGGAGGEGQIHQETLIFRQL
jgi:4-hydroxy-2-oxoheptanedioate aldolase